MEVWQIGDSPYAPKFHIISQPNDWAKAVKKTTTRSALSDTKMLQLEFWSQFREYAQEHNGKIKLRKADAQHWYNVSFGFSTAQITLTVNSLSGQMACELYIHDSDRLFSALFEKKEKIESELSEHLQWEPLPGKKASRIKLINNAELTNQDNWDVYHAWMLDKATAFHKVFARHIKACGNGN